MAPWPEVENAQPNSEECTTKGKETHKGKCRPSPPGLAPREDPGDLGLVPHCSWPLLLVWADDTGTPGTKIELQPSHSAMALVEEPPKVEDPWDLPELKNTGIKWSGKNEALEFPSWCSG